MKHGFIKVASAAPQMRLTDCLFNAQAIAECAKDAGAKGIKLLVTPAHADCGGSSPAASGQAI